MRITKTIEEEVPFDITPFKQFINKFDGCIDEDEFDDWVYYECIDLGYTDEELEEHYEEFKQVISEFNDSYKSWELGEKLNNTLYELSRDGYTEKEIINHIKNWFI